MSEHPDEQQLRALLDDRLGPGEAAAVEGHVEGCRTCQRALEQAEPRVPLPVGGAAAAWDERRMRRLVRRALMRTAFDALSILFVVVLVLFAVGAFVVQPLVVDRGDRVDRVRTVTDDLPVLLTPGAVPTAARGSTGLFSRTFERTFVRFVGSEGQDLGSYESTLGPIGWQAHPWTIRLDRVRDGRGSATPFAPDRLPDGTVASVLLVFEHGIDFAAADALAAEASEVSLQWVGFRVPVVDDVRGSHLRPGPESAFDVGYLACRSGAPATRRDDEEWVPRTEPGSAMALEGVRRATSNLAASHEVLGHLRDRGEPVIDRIDAVTSWLESNEPDVTAAVLTGPTAAIAEIVDDAEPDDTVQLGIDLYNGPGSPCA